jgi:methyltransferase (TIGR00027 family)
MTGRQVHEPRARRRGGPGDPLRPSQPAVAIPVTSPQSCCPSTGQRDRYVDELIEVGSSASMPDLCGPRLPAALYRVRDRGGLGVVAVSDSALTEHQHDVLSRFRFAQYLAAGFIDRDVAFRERLDRDTLTDAPVQRCADTVHFIVFASDSGLLLASVCLLALPGAEPGVRVRSRDRHLFPVEEHFGWGVFNRLALVPDTPVDRVREFGRLVKNSRCDVGPRAVVELCLAAARVLTGPLAMAVDVCIGEFETNAARRGLEFMHTPMVVLAGGLPVFPPGHPLNPALDGRDRYPFAFLISDGRNVGSRLDAIEAALAKPDPQGVAELAALKRIPCTTPSSLMPPDGIPTLSNTPLPQRAMSLPARRRARALGDQLGRFRAFAGLSDTERTTLRTFTTQTDLEPGRVILRRGQVADELVLIDTGQAELRIPGCPPGVVLGPGDCIGAGGVLAGSPGAGDVVARTPMRVLGLPADGPLPLLRELPEVELELQRLALADLRSQQWARAAHCAATPSRLATNSAEAMAALRAAGAVVRDPALRNPDHLAGAFLTTRLQGQALAKIPGARRLVPALAERLLPGGYHYETARVRHIDAILRAELRQGLDQLVLLGAGYDTRPYRFADELRDVRVYEVDLPLISRTKRRKVARVLGRLPDHVTYIEADFCHDDVYNLLRERAYDLDGATLLILSGVTPYLPEWAVARLLAFASRHTCPRTSIAFDYVYRQMVDGDDAFHGAAQARRRLEALGEPFRFGIPQGAAAHYIEPFGLKLASHLTPDELARLYLRTTDGNLAGEPYGFAAIAHARVPTPRFGTPPSYGDDRGVSRS